MKRKHTEHLKCHLSQIELIEHSREMAKHAQELENLKNEQKEAAASYKSQITAKESAMSRESTIVNNGYEYRTVDCEIQMNQPTRGEKTCYRLDTGEIVWTKGMNSDDLQNELPLSEIVSTVE